MSFFKTNHSYGSIRIVYLPSYSYKTGSVRRPSQEPDSKLSSAFTTAPFSNTIFCRQSNRGLVSNSRLTLLLRKHSFQQSAISLNWRISASQIEQKSTESSEMNLEGFLFQAARSESAKVVEYRECNETKMTMLPCAILRSQ